MGVYKGERRKVRVDGEYYTIAQLAKKVGITPFAMLRRYNHRKARGMEMSIRVLAKDLNGTPKKLLKPRHISQLASQIRKHMITQGRTVRDLADTLGIHPASATRMLSDLRSINPERLAKIADWLMLTEEEEAELHVLGARERGWKV